LKGYAFAFCDFMISPVFLTFQKKGKEKGHGMCDVTIQRIHRMSQLMRGIIVLMFVFGSPAVVAAECNAPQTPYAAVSFYVDGTGTESEIFTRMQEWGDAQGSILSQTNVQSSLVILAFGTPKFRNETHGVKTPLQDTFLPLNTVLQASAYYIIGLNNGLRRGSNPQVKVRVIVGTNNFDDGTNNLTAQHGDIFGNIPVRLRDWLNRNNVRNILPHGGSDIELAYSSPQQTFTWLRGYREAQRRLNGPALISFGASEGCPQSGSSATTGICRPSENTPWVWTQSEAVQAHWALGLPIPQIYSNGGGNARAWQQLMLHGNLRFNRSLLLPGVLTQSMACMQVTDPQCPLLDNTPEEAWRQLYCELNSDSRTAQPLRRATDIMYQRQNSPAPQ
jgi:hypothetical protein